MTAISAQARRAGLNGGITWKALALTGALSAAAHAAVLAALAPGSDSVQMQGGAPAAVAALGNAFEDLTQGAVPSAPSMAQTSEIAPAAPMPPPAAQTPVAPVEPTAAEAPSEAPPMENPIALAAVPRLVSPSPFALAVPSTPTTAPTEATPVALTRPAPTRPTTAAQPVTPPTLAPIEEPEIAVREADASTPRPPDRAALEARRERAEAQQQEAPRAERPRQAAAAQAAGNSEQQARRGSSEGTQGTAAASTAGQAQASAPGNAAVSNYPGQVMRRIQRVRQQRVRARGRAVVAFTVDANGGLAGARLSRASGSAELDAAALDHIRRAAPFPAPPPGAQRNFSFEFVGR